MTIFHFSHCMVSLSCLSALLTQIMCSHSHSQTQNKSTRANQTKSMRCHININIRHPPSIGQFCFHIVWWKLCNILKHSSFSILVSNSFKHSTVLCNNKLTMIESTGLKFDTVNQRFGTFHYWTKQLAICVQ